MATRSRKRKLCASPDLPFALLQTVVLQLVPRADVLLALAYSCKALNAAVQRLSMAHLRALDGGKHAHWLPDDAFARMRVPRALHILVYGRCEVCGKGNTRATFRTHWDLFAHNKCISTSCVNACMLLPDTRDKLVSACAPFDVRTVYTLDHRRIPAAYFWKRDTGLLPAHWTVEGVMYMGADECEEAGEDEPASVPAQDRAALAEILDELPRFWRGWENLFW